MINIDADLLNESETKGSYQGCRSNVEGENNFSLWSSLRKESLLCMLKFVLHIACSSPSPGFKIPICLSPRQIHSIVYELSLQKLSNELLLQVNVLRGEKLRRERNQT